jgi:hypothetical protein
MKALVMRSPAPVASFLRARPPWSKWLHRRRPSRGTVKSLVLGVLCAVTTIVVFADSSGGAGRASNAFAADESWAWQSSLYAAGDPCLNAAPPVRPPRSFDVDVESAGFANLHARAAGAMPVFDVWNEDGLFRRDADAAHNLTSSDLDLRYDAVANPVIARRALSAFYNVPSLAVKAIYSQYVHLDRRRTQFVLHTRLEPHPSVAARSNRVLIQRSGDGKCRVGVIPEAPDKTRTPIHVVVSYSGTGFGRPRRMSRFILQVEMMQAHPILVRSQKLKLVIALHDMTEAAFRHQFELTDRFAHPDVQVVEPPTVAGAGGVPFSRAAALRRGAQLVPTSDLLFICDIDMHIYPPFFTSCRANAVQGSQVYFPVPYNLYPGEQDVAAHAGSWLGNSTGMACMYRADFDKVRPRAAPYEQGHAMYSGPGKEDADLMDAFAAQPRTYRVFRAVEPWLRHAWHVKACAWNMRRFQDCLRDAYAALGAGALVGSHFIKQHDMDLQFPYRRYDEDWDPEEKAISLKRTKTFYLEKPPDQM